MTRTDTAGWSLIAMTAGLVLAVGIAGAAGTTAVTITPDEATVDVGNETTFDVNVAAADGGVGSFDLTVRLATRGVGNVTDASIAGDPATVSRERRVDSVRLAATGLDTADDGTVTLATITVRGADAGETALDVSVTDLGDEAGRSYEVSGTDGASLTVEAVPTPTATATDEDDDIREENYENPTPTPTATATATATATPTASPTATDGGGAATTPVEETPDDGESLPTGPLAIGGVVVLLTIAGVGVWLRA